MSGEIQSNGEREKNGLKTSKKTFVNRLIEKMITVMNVEVMDEEASRIVERMAVVRVSTKHINLWIRQLEMKRNEICQLAGLMGVDEVKKEIEAEKSLEKWAKRCTNHFTRKAKRMLFEEIDNMVWSGRDEGIVRWCSENKVYDEITEEEIEEIWNREDPDEDEPTRLNWKFVWETSKRVCNFINGHEELIQITTFGEYRTVMRKVMRVIREAHNAEKKRRRTSQKRS